MSASKETSAEDRAWLFCCIVFACAVVIAALSFSLWLAVQFGSSIDCELRPHTQRCAILAGKEPAFKLREPRP